LAPRDAADVPAIPGECFGAPFLNWLIRKQVALGESKGTWCPHSIIALPDKNVRIDTAGREIFAVRAEANAVDRPGVIVENSKQFVLHFIGRRERGKGPEFDQMIPTASRKEFTRWVDI
jgi:hypothetical protein